MRRKGFTLIELLVVISIIALLLSILFPALARVKESGRRTICMAHAKALATAIHAYAVENKDNVPGTTDDMNAAYNHYVFIWNQYICPYPASDAWFGLGLLHKENIVEEADTFFCPSQKHPLLDKDLYFPAKRFRGYEGKLPKNFNPNGSRAMGSLSYGLPGQVACDKEDKDVLEVQNMKIYNMKTLPLVTDVFIPLKYDGVYKSSFAHTGKRAGITVGFGDGSVEFVRLHKIVFDLAMELRAYDVSSGNYGLVHRADLFAATMFKLVCKQPYYMEKYFNDGNPIPVIP